MNFLRNLSLLYQLINWPIFSFNSSNVKEGVVLVDVGIHRNNNNKISGDLDFLSFSEKASYITPVPGGVGPMTVISLILNLIKSYILQFPEQKVLFKDFLRYIF